MEIAYTPLADFSFGIDQESGLEKKLVIIGFKINAKSETIEIFYEIVFVNPTGKLGQILSSGSYIRENANGNNKYDQLKGSQAGTIIIAMLAADMQMIQGIGTFVDDLKQN